jgi:hypothetical protein
MRGAKRGKLKKKVQENRPGNRRRNLRCFNIATDWMKRTISEKVIDV